MCDFGPFSRIGGLWEPINRASGRLRSMAAHSPPFAAPYRALEPLRGAASRIGVLRRAAVAHWSPFAAGWHRSARPGDCARRPSGAKSVVTGPCLTGNT